MRIRAKKRKKNKRLRLRLRNPETYCSWECCMLLFSSHSEIILTFLVYAVFWHWSTKIGSGEGDPFLANDSIYIEIWFKEKYLWTVNWMYRMSFHVIDFLVWISEYLSFCTDSFGYFGCFEFCNKFARRIPKRRKHCQKLRLRQPRRLNLQTVLKMPHVVFLIILQDTTLPVGDSSKSLRMLVNYNQIEGFNHTGTAILHRLMRRCDTEGRILESYYVRVINPNCNCQLYISRGLLNRQFWMLWILQQFCAGDDEDTSSAKPAAGAEAAEKERDLHAEVGWGGSGKWQVAWFVNTIRRGGLENPQPAGKGRDQFVFWQSLPTD